jgi:hypothetical protein
VPRTFANFIKARPENPWKRGYNTQYFRARDSVLASKPMCYKCKTKLATEVDHVRPLIRGGSNTARNLRPICVSCNRKSGGGERRLRKSVQVDAMVAAALKKASFGGDRSAAGRYAAEQRWKNHQKKETPSTETKTSPPNEITQRLVAAQSDLNAKGYTTKRYAKGETFNSDEVFKQMGEKLYNPKISDRAREGLMMMFQAIRRFEDSPNTILITVEKDGEVVGASVLEIPPDSDKAELVYAGSTAEVKGTGSAMFADVIKTVASAEKRLFLKSVDDAYDFWKGMGFRMVGAFGTMGVKKVSEMAKDLS